MNEGRNMPSEKLPHPSFFEKGRRYRLVIEGIKEPWEVNYLGPSYADDLQFDARPIAGTQTVAPDRILDAEDIGPAIWSRS